MIPRLSRFGRRDGFTLIELLIVVALLGVLTTMGMAGLVGARRAANEASAIASLRAINSAQHVYAAGCGNGYYAASLGVLGSAPTDGAPFLSPDLATAPAVVKSGYLITLARGSDSTAPAEPGCNPMGQAANLTTGYYATADPVGTFNGTRHFWTNPQSVIFFDPTAPITHHASMTLPPAAMLEGQATAGGAATGGQEAAK